MADIELIQGETFRAGLTITGLDPSAERIEITWRNSLGKQVKKWTLDSGITELSANNYAYYLTNLETLAVPGRGTWQIEVVSTALGVKKSFSGTYEIAKATNLTTEVVAIVPTNFNRLQNVDFSVIDNPVLEEWVEEFVQAATTAESEAAAIAAAASALAASNSAATATTQAGIATSASGVATTKANEAAGSADNADDSATAATTQAGIATTQAGIATTKASEASTSATNAATSETNAATSEENAALSASNASASAIAADAARDEAVLVAGNILTLVSYTDTTVTMGIGGSVTIEEGPSIYPSTSITFL